MPPGPTNHWLIGHMLRAQRTPLTFFTELTEQYGGLVHFQAGFQSVYLATHPTYIETHLAQSSDLYQGDLYLQDAWGHVG